MQVQVPPKPNVIPRLSPTSTLYPALIPHICIILAYLTVACLVQSSYMGVGESLEPGTWLAKTKMVNGVLLATTKIRFSQRMLIHSPKHCEYSSLLTGQIPVSLAWRCWRRVSSCSWRLMTSSRVAGVLETHCTHSCPASDHSRGGRMELRISSVCWFFCASTGGSLPLGGEGMGPPLPIAAIVGFWVDLGVRACVCVCVKSEMWHYVDSVGHL